MKITCFNDLVTEAKTRKSVLAVVNAHEQHTLEAIMRAKNEGICEAILIGDAGKITDIIEQCGANKEHFEIVDAPEKNDALLAAIEAIKTGRADTLMKGGIETGDFLKSILSRDNDLRGDGLFSAFGLYEIARYHKIFAVSDFAMNIMPNIEEKKTIIKNGVGLLRSLGIETPKVAVLSETERLNPKIPASVDAAQLKRMWKAGWLKNCVLEGPISFDLAMDREAAGIKNFESPVAGDADLLIVPDIIAGNVFVKSLTTLAGARTAGLVLGAKIPIILSSRSSASDDKFYSIALASVTANTYMK